MVRVGVLVGIVLVIVLALVGVFAAGVLPHQTASPASAAHPSVHVKHPAAHKAPVVSAAALKLQALTLPASQAPKGFTHPRTRLYSGIVSRMSVASRAGVVRSPVSCAVPTFARSDGMRAGFIQGFNSVRVGYTLQVCAYSFGSTQKAHAFFTGFARTLLLPRVTMHLDKRMTLRLGDESVATNHGEATCSCSTAISMRTYNVLWRQGNVDVLVAYAGPVGYTLPEFHSLVTGASKRLA